MGRVFTCALIILQKISINSAAHEKRSLWQACFNLTKTACVVLNNVAARQEARQEIVGVAIVQHVIALLLQIVKLICEADDASILVNRFCSLFQENNLLRSVGILVVVPQSEIVTTTLIYLLICLVESQERSALVLLSDNRMVLTDVMSSKSYSRDGRSLFLLSLKFIECCLRTCQASTCSKEHSESFRVVAASFMIAREFEFFNVLHDVSLVNFGRVHPNRNVLNLLKLEEAKCILAFLSLFCGDKRASRKSLLDQDVVQRLKEQVSTIASNLSTYLGAVASARALFRLIDQEIKTEDILFEHSGNHSLESNPFRRIMLRGMQSARNEAIEYCSHFVENKVASGAEIPMSTSDDILGSWKQIVQGNYWSEEEKKSIKAVANVCSFDKEAEVAECLFHALRFLWAIHPAADSFVMFTEEEVRNLETWRIVHTGSTIAFRSYGGEILRGKVLRRDALSMKWNVEAVIDQKREILTIDEHQLVGIQDKSSLLPCLKFEPAPETASDLDRSMASPSLGHLLLTSRWCRQFAEELQLTGMTTTSKYACALQDLTELTCLLTAEEASIHYDSRQLLPSDALFAIKVQVLDLYGDSDDLSKAGMQNRDAASVNLNDIIGLSTKLWCITRNRLFPYLQGPDLLLQ
jgi:hypothetical protein